MLNEDDNIENQAPNLVALKGRDSFKVPENYFNELPNKIEDKLPKKGKLIRLINIKNLAYAASVAFIVTVSLFVFNKDGVTIDANTPNSLLAENSITFEDLTIEDYFNEITNQEINLEAIIFEDIDLGEIEINEEYSVLLDDIELDPTTLISFDDEWSLFE